METWYLEHEEKRCRKTDSKVHYFKCLKLKGIRKGSLDTSYGNSKTNF